MFKDSECTEKAMSSSCHVCLCPSRLVPVVMGREENVTGPVIEKEGNETEAVFIHLFIRSFIMSLEAG